MVHDEFVKGFIEECMKKGATYDEILEAAEENFEEKSEMPELVEKKLKSGELGEKLLANEMAVEYKTKIDIKGLSISEIREYLSDHEVEICEEGNRLTYKRLQDWVDSMDDCPKCDNRLMWDGDKKYCPVHD